MRNPSNRSKLPRCWLTYASPIEYTNGWYPVSHSSRLNSRVSHIISYISWGSLTG